MTAHTTSCLANAMPNANPVVGGLMKDCQQRALDWISYRHTKLIPRAWLEGFPRFHALPDSLS